MWRIALSTPPRVPAPTTLRCAAMAAYCAPTSSAVRARRAATSPCARSVEPCASHPRPAAAPPAALLAALRRHSSLSRGQLDAPHNIWQRPRGIRWCGVGRRAVQLRQRRRATAPSSPTALGGPGHAAAHLTAPTPPVLTACTPPSAARRTHRFGSSSQPSTRPPPPLATPCARPVWRALHGGMWPAAQPRPGACASSSRRPP